MRIGIPYSGTYLPEVAKEQGWDQKQSIAQLLRKSGYKGGFESVKSTLTAERYQSVMYTATYKQYTEFMAKNKDFFTLSTKKLRDSMGDDADDEPDPEDEDEKVEAEKGSKAGKKK